MKEGHYLSGRLLLAMPGMFDRRFARTVNVMCVHDENGAMGVNIGHTRSDMGLHKILKELKIDPGVAPDCAVHNGGPMDQGRGFVLHSTDWGGVGTMQVNPLCAMSSSLDILRSIADGSGPSKWLIALGYAGWGAGQLESEMRLHGWYAADGRSEILFETGVKDRWNATWRAEGVDPAVLSPAIGQA